MNFYPFAYEYLDVTNSVHADHMYELLSVTRCMGIISENHPAIRDKQRQ